MRLTYRFPLAVGAALALMLSACGSSDEEAKPSADAAKESETIAPQEVPEGESEQDAGTDTTASATPSDSAGGGSAGGSQAVTGTPTVTDTWVHVGESGADACELTGDYVTCYFETDSSHPDCPGDAVMAVASFAGGKVTYGCQSAGDAGDVPFAHPGDIISDPTGAFKCEVVSSPNLGVRCTDANGVTALLSAIDPRVL